MKKSTIVLIIVASSLVALGLVVFAVAMSILGFNFANLDTKLENNTHEISDSFDKINLVTDVGDVIFIRSEDDRCIVECNEREKVFHDVSVDDGVLNVVLNDQRKWYDHIGIFSIGEYYVKVYLPEENYDQLSVKASTADVKIPGSFTFGEIDVRLSTGDTECYASATGLIKIKSSTGDIELKNLSAGSLDLTVSTGEIEIESVNCANDVSIGVTTGDTSIEGLKCKNFDSDGSTGDMLLKELIASEKLCIERSTGHVEFIKSDAAEICINTDTGKVYGTLLSDKIFFVKTDTGKVNVPKSTVGGTCEITTDTGNISITIEKGKD